jgi:hypothetical protein
MFVLQNYFCRFSVLSQPQSVLKDVECTDIYSGIRWEILRLSGSIPIIFLLRITTTSNKCEMLNNLNLKVGGSSGRVVNRCC